MKKGKSISIVACLLAVVFGFSMQSHAELFNRGTDSLGNRLIYDSDLGITWYDYTNAEDTWQNQMNWASALTVDFGGQIYDDWSLPTTNDIGNDGCFWSYNGTDCGYNVETSAGMAHLWYNELGNIAYYDTNASGPQAGWGLTNAGDFQHLQPEYYWSGTEAFTDPLYAWYFGTNYGVQFIYYKTISHYAIAVRPGDVSVVPEPISSALFITGGMLLAGKRYVKER